MSEVVSPLQAGEIQQDRKSSLDPDAAHLQPPRSAGEIVARLDCDIDVYVRDPHDVTIGGRRPESWARRLLGVSQAVNGLVCVRLDLDAGDRVMVHPAPSGWQQRLFALRKDVPSRELTTEEEAEHRGWTDAINAVCELFAGQNAKDALSPAQPCGMCGGTGVARRISQAEEDEAFRSLDGIQELLESKEPRDGQ